MNLKKLAVVPDLLGKSSEGKQKKGLDLKFVSLMASAILTLAGCTKESADAPDMPPKTNVVLKSTGTNNLQFDYSATDDKGLELVAYTIKDETGAVIAQGQADPKGAKEFSKNFYVTGLAENTDYKAQFETSDTKGHEVIDDSQGKTKEQNTTTTNTPSSLEQEIFNFNENTTAAIQLNPNDQEGVTNVSISGELDDYYNMDENYTLHLKEDKILDHETDPVIIGDVTIEDSQGELTSIKTRVVLADQNEKTGINTYFDHDDNILPDGSLYASIPDEDSLESETKIQTGTGEVEPEAITEKYNEGDGILEGMSGLISSLILQGVIEKYENGQDRVYPVVAGAESNGFNIYAEDGTILETLSYSEMRRDMDFMARELDQYGFFTIPTTSDENSEASAFLNKYEAESETARIYFKLLPKYIQSTDRAFIISKAVEETRINEVDTE